MEDFTLNISSKFSSAVQITRPKPATKPGSSSSANSPHNIKVAKLVLKPASPSISNKAIKTVNKPSSPQRREASTVVARSQTAPDSLRLNNRNKSAEAHLEPQVKHQQTVELEKKTRKAEKERKALSQQQPVEASPSHKSSAMDEAMRIEAREYIKKQREKRKLEVKKEVDKSFVIKQRLDELRKTTRNVIKKKGKSQVKISPPKNYYSMSSVHIKEIKVLRLKPMNGRQNKSPEKVSFIDMDDQKLRAPGVENMEASNVIEISPEKLMSPASPVKKISSPMRKLLTPTRKQFSPIRKPSSPVKKPAIPLQIQNSHTIAKPAVAQPARPSSAKENKKPYDDLKLKVPDVKLSMLTMNRSEVPAYKSILQPQVKIPFWLENTAIQPYPYNFIWAVRKKLEAYNSADERQRKAREKRQNNFETPHIKNGNKLKKGRKLPDFTMKHNDTKDELQRPTIASDSDSSETSMEREANTISEISSIKSDLALVKSRSQEKERSNGDDTTISESIFQSLKDEVFIGKNRESINSEFDRTSFGKKVVALPENSPNTSEKRENFLSSTKLPLVHPAAQNDLDSNKHNQKKEEEYQKMLSAFNQSLSHVIQVNGMLSKVLSSKSSSLASQTTSGTIKNYSSSFENNVESEVQKTLTESNISEMIENLVQKSRPAPPPAVPRSDSNSSIDTFIEDSKSTALPHNVEDIIEDPPIIYNEPAQEVSSSTTKVTTSTTEIVQLKLNHEKKEEYETTLNESKFINMFKNNESENSFNITLADNNASFGMLMDKSSSEIKSWEKTLVDRTRGQIAWLELQKQNFRKHGQLEKVSAIKKQQRAILLRLEKERLKLKDNSERSLVKFDESLAVVDMSADVTMNESDARENIERILKQREQKIIKRRAQVDHLINWQKKLDNEEEKLKQMEKELLGANTKKLSSPRKKKSNEDILNSSIKMVKSIDKSLVALSNIEPASGEETVEVTGLKLNKLWYRLTGVQEQKYHPLDDFNYSKEDFAKFYEEAKEYVLQSDLKLLLETSIPQVAPASEESLKKDTEHGSNSDVSTMNSIANIETEEEFPGSLPYEPETPTPSATENDEDLHEMLANQMKVFIDHKKPAIDEMSKEVSVKITSPIADNATFQVRPETPEDLYQSSSTVGASEMEIEQDSFIQTEPLISFDNSSVDADGSIIPEVKELQVTDMDDDAGMELIEDTSFPTLEISFIDDAIRHEENDRNDLSTITECTEYEQSQGSSNEEEISEAFSTATTSERQNSEIEKRLISINDSLEDVNEAFNKIKIFNRSPSTVTYSTDKDFIASPKASTSDENSATQNLLIFSPIESDSSTKGSGQGSGSQMTTSTPKIKMPDILSEVSDGQKEANTSDDF